MLKLVPGLADTWVPHGDGSHLDFGGGLEIVLNDKFEWQQIPKIISSVIYALKSVHGLAYVGVLHEDGDGPRTPSRSLEGVWKKFQMTNLTTRNNFSVMKYALKSVSGPADVGVLHEDGDGPRTPPRCLERAGKNFKWLILPCLTIVVLWNML